MLRSFVPVSVLLLALSLACTTSTIASVFKPTSTSAETPQPANSSTSTSIPTSTPEPGARVKSGDQALFEGDYQRAQTEYQNALNSSNNEEVQAASLLGIARTSILQGDCPSAENSLKTILNLYSDSAQRPFVFFFQALCLEQRKEFTQAANAYSKYLELRPGRIDAYIQEARGDDLSEGGDYPGALTAYQTARQVADPSTYSGIDLKIAKTYLAAGDQQSSIRKYQTISDDPASNDYVKAQADFLLGKIYLSQNKKQQAFARFQDSVAKYPRSYDSYSSLVALLDGGQEVDGLEAGLVYYYAGKYGQALDTLTRYVSSNPKHDGTAHHYKALSFRANDQSEQAVAEWDALIKDHAGDRFFTNAWEEKAYTQWAYLDRFEYGAETLLSFVRLYPTAAEAPDFLFEAGRIYERNNQIPDAAAIWERVIAEYPSAEKNLRSLFLAGVCHYRLSNFSQAQTIFQRMLVLSTNTGDQSQAYFWIGKTQQKQNNPSAAKVSWEQSAERDPTGYYSERARLALKDRAPDEGPSVFDMGFDLDRERVEAESWLRKTFSIPGEINLSDLGPLAGDARFLRASAFWELGLMDEALPDLESLRKDVGSDAVFTFRLMNYLYDRGFYRSAILCSRQILTLASLSDAQTLQAPAFFNHIRFGTYFKDLVLPDSNEDGFHPLFIYSVMRQESLFEGFAQSSAGARGLMQIIPSTGAEVAANLAWPENYSNKDLYRPLINIKLGTHYLARQRDYFDGDLYAALAAYNGGPTNSGGWKQLAQNDPDLFLEIIRIDETRQYVKQVMENFFIYTRLYERAP